MSQPERSVPSRIETERLTLRRYVAADAEQLAEVVPRNMAHLERYMEWIAFEPQTVEQRVAWIDRVSEQFDAGEDYTLGIFAPDGALLGGTGFHVRTDPDRVAIGYWIDKDHEGKGLVTEASAALTLVALEVVGAPLVAIEHAPTNIRSAAIPQRLGFVRQAVAPQECNDSGEMVPSVVWIATRDTLAQEPLASWPRPTVYDKAGNEVPWPE